MDAEDFARLVVETGDKAYNFACRLTGNEQDARDLVQEAYARAFESSDSYDLSRPFDSWLLTILRHVYLDAMRRVERARTVSLDAPLPGDAEPGESWESVLPGGDEPAGDALAGRESLDLLQLALERLAPHYRAAVTLCDIEGLSYEEGAKVMGVPVGTVRSRLHEGRVKLREAYERVEKTAGRMS